MKRKHRFFNMYLTTTISVALVLLLVGMEVVLLLSAHQIIRQVKENVALTVVLNDEADSTQVGRLENLLTIAPFVKDYVYISKDDALKEHISSLGEDPTQFLGFNPLLAAYEVHLNADYAQADSIASIERKLKVFPCVNTVVYQKDVVSALDNNINRISILLLAVAFVLLFVALALLINTIRLQVYSKRFLINTMRLVGATPWVIRRPIVRKNALIGFVASLLALLMLFAALWYAQNYMGITLLMLNWQNIAIVSITVVSLGLIITILASVFATNRYVRMDTDSLYYV